MSDFNLTLWEYLEEEKSVQQEQERKVTLTQTAALLRTYFSQKRVREVYLTGSLLQEGKFSRFSDIDVAVLGLQEDYFKTLVDLERLLDRTVDLIELEGCHFRDDIMKRGLRVW
ncbi:MAG: nucleotidyltransferase domain-containing protein [Atribacterota bacterium]|nr:nucleotidyltransferase domain-containing protein [Atribacterota bacterium]